ncbi:uncharacterized protein LOC124307073 isoform X1 [Neodiprion virginianus]|uniref:uncharacterized protein LOC124307073 isoform X1 n=1 Tax=Neodiprion virginianus TaxID=2961670 RepID=UPI001EE72ACB|nr:uncharacterized protein LOC124307073 isoform X1 [Neodiprion virginianus]
MTGSRVRPRVLTSLFLALLAVALQGVQGEEELGVGQVPSEVQCRPYIEKALKDLGTGSLEENSVEVGEATDEDEAPPLNEQSEEPTEADNDDDDNNDNDDDAGEDDGDHSVEDTDDGSDGGDGADDGGSNSGEDDDELAANEPAEDKAQAASSEDTDGESENVETVEITSAEAAAENQSEDDDVDEADNVDDDDDNDDQRKDAKSIEETEEAASQETDGVAENDADGSTEDKEDETAEEDGDRTEEVKDVESEEEDNTNDTDSGEDNVVDNESSEEKDDDKKSAEEQDGYAREDDNHSNSAEGGDSDVGDAGNDDTEEKTDGAGTESEEKQDDDSKQDESDGDTDNDDGVKKDADDVEDSKEDSREENAEGQDETKESTETNEGDNVSAESSDGDKKSEESEEVKSRERREVGVEAEDGVEVDDDKSSKEEDGDEEKTDSVEVVEDKKSEGSSEEEGAGSTPEEDLIQEIEVPENLRPRDHINQLLKLDEENEEKERAIQKAADIVLRDLKRLYDTAIKPLETLYKYRDLSNRHFGDPEIFSKPLVLFMGPWSGGKSSIINYLLDNEYKPTSLRTGISQECIEEPCKPLNGTDTGAEPSPAYFNILMHGEEEEILDGTQLAADWTFSGLQKFGQGMLDRLRGIRLNNKLLEKVNIVEIPGILEIRKQVQRLFPFNDACQWFIDRADIIFLVYDPAKLDVGPETEAILDQLKGREYQTRIILNKADQVKPEELMRVQGALIWNISPLMSSAEPPIMYSTSLWSLPYEAGAPTRLLYAQERAFLRDLRSAVDKRVEHKIASARRFAVRVRNHAKMVDCYLTTYYNHKTFFGNKKDISDKIIENPQDYHIYEGLSTLTNISRYDLPDPDVYKDFFRLNALYDFQQLSTTCTYFRGCPINRLDVAIAYDLPELVGKYKKSVEVALHESETIPPSS